MPTPGLHVWVGEENWRPRDRAKAALAPVGPGSKRTTGGHIDDLAALGKAITLCPSDTKRFNRKAYEYEIERRYLVRAWCDGCGQFHPACRLLLKKGAGPQL